MDRQPGHGNDSTSSPVDYFSTRLPQQTRWTMLPRRFEESVPQLGQSARADQAIRGTDGDALISRISAVNAGYLHDPFASLIAKAPSSSTTRRVPLINVGTHHRTWALDKLVDSFLESGDKDKPRQIVSLGAGSDTRFWRLMSRASRPNVSKYVEIDFDDVTSIKARRICMNKTLSAAISSPSPSSSSSSSDAASSIPAQSKPQVSQGGSRLDTPIYTLLPLDLRIKKDSQAQAQENDPLDALSTLLDPDLPTLFLAECVYCYMQPEESERVIEWFAAKFKGKGGCLGVVYEMCGLDDSFGLVMRRNLQARGIQLPGAVFANPQAQAERFLKAGFEKAEGVSLRTIRRDFVPRDELERISKLEMLDEVEELELMLDHYCIAWGSVGPVGETIGLS